MLLSWPFHMPGLLESGTVSALGGSNAQDTNLTPGLPISYPGCRLICHVHIRSSPVVSCATPAGWNLMAQDIHVLNGFGQWLFWADHGAAAPSIDWNSANSVNTGAISRIYSIVNVNTSNNWYFIGNRLDAAASGTVSIPSLKTKAAQRLAMSFNCVTNLSTPFDEPSGESGGSWVEDITEATTTLGSDATIQVLVALQKNAGTISGGTTTITGTPNWLCRTIGIHPLSDKRGEVVYTVNASPRPQIILDTDIDSDIDDVADAVFFFNLEADGEIDLKAAVVTSAQIHASVCFKTIANYYNRSALPVGANTSSQGATSNLYVTQTAAAFPAPGFTQASDFPAALTVVRQALADAADKSIEYMTTGSLDTVKLLLESAGDGISPLSGIELVRQKVRFFFCVAGSWPQGAGVSDFGGTSARATVSNAVLQNWPAKDVPIIFLDIPDADDIETGENAMIALSSSNPARFAWETYFGNANTTNKRGAWSQVAMLGLARGIWPNSITGTDWHRVFGRRGTASVNTSTGATDWDFDTEGGHAWLRRMEEKPLFVSTINALLLEPA